MSSEERDELINFILQSQSNAAQWREEHESNMRDFEKRMRETEKKDEEFRSELRELAVITRGLVEIARRHDPRLDLLEGLSG